MTVLTCAAVRKRLAAYYDNELPISERISVQSHLNGCPPCAEELATFESLGAVIREASAPGPADDWTGLQPGVISRMLAEEHEALPARVGRMFDDMHLVWIAMAATAATVVCGAIVLGMLHFASPEREDSLAAMIAIVSAPSGSDMNPASLDGLMRAPSIPAGDGIVSDTLEQSGSGGEMRLTFSAVVTRDGKISGMEVVDRGAQPRASQLMNGFARARLEPARNGGDPIAVNLVWLVEHMTVRGKVRS